MIKRIIGLIQKLVIMLWILLQELFSKTVVIKMSVTTKYNGELIKANWGDDINYWFLREIIDGRLVNYNWSLLTKILHKPYVAGIGSILTLFNMDRAIVWGSGILCEKDKVDGKPLAVRAVRGPLTRKKLLAEGIDCPEVYGDPALLIPRYYTPKVEKKYEIGIIQQYDGQDNKLLDGLRNRNDVLFIDIKQYGHWLDFVDQICTCKVIASSSLHGLIISEAYKIPNVWTTIKGDVPTDEFKYHDFFLSIGRDRSLFYVEDQLTVDDILLKAKEWVPGDIDCDSLLRVCPFRLKSNHLIKRNIE